MSVEVVPFVSAEHESGAVAALLGVRRATGLYPPPQDADPTTESLRSWLLNGQVLGRWVALSQDAVVGHVQVTDAADYLVTFLAEHLPGIGSVVEIGKLYVAPDRQKLGAGSALLQKSFEFASHAGVKPALAVLPDSVEAIGLYERAGMDVVGTFVGVHGLNLVMLRREDLPANSSEGR